MSKTAVISGGAGGLGRALADQLRGEGWYVVQVDLPSLALDEIADDAQGCGMACDLTDEAAMQAMCAELREKRPSIDLVIYNAGITQIGAFDETPIEAHRRVFDINYFAAVTMARELVGDLRASKGIHLGISSVAGFAPLYRRAAYAASKHALEGFFKSLRSEEQAYGVDCLIAAPSFVATNLGNPEEQDGGIARPGSATDGVDYMSADDAATVILKGVKARRKFIPVGRVARLAYLVNRLSPALFERLMNRAIAKEQS